MSGEWVVSVPGNEFTEVLSPEDFKAQYEEVKAVLKVVPKAVPKK